MRLLLVDDDETTLRLLGGLLASEGHVIDKCQSAASALEHLRTKPYDVLLTDMVMSTMNGLELVTNARELHPTLRCMVMSGHSRNERVPSDVGWIKKPVDFDGLLAMLASAPPAPSDGRFREVFEGAPDGIFIADPDGRYTNVNELLLSGVASAVVRDMADWCAVDVVRDHEVQRVKIVHADPARASVCDALQRRRLERPVAEPLAEFLTSQRPTLMSEIPPASSSRSPTARSTSCCCRRSTHARA